MKITIYLIVLALIVNINLTAQEIIQQQNDKKGKSYVIDAYASNYTPAVNEPVTLTLRAYLTQDVIIELKHKGKPWGAYVRFGFRPEEGVEIISGESEYNQPIEEEGAIEMTMTVKFTKSKQVRIVAGIIRSYNSVSKEMNFIVGGGYFESKEVEGIKRAIEKMHKSIEEYEKFGTRPQTTNYYYQGRNLREKPADWGGRSREYRSYLSRDLDVEPTFGYLDTFQVSVLDKAIEWNINKYKEYQKEYDALVYVIKAIDEKIHPNYFDRKIFLKDYKLKYEKNGIDTNQHPVLKKYENLIMEKKPSNYKEEGAIKRTSSIDGPITATKNHDSYRNYQTDKNISSISLNPTTIGDVFIGDDDNWFEFKGGDVTFEYGENTVEGTMTITYTDDSTEEFDVEVYGDFEIRVNLVGGCGFYVELWDVPKYDDDSILEQGYLVDGEITFEHMDAADYKIKLYKYSDKVQAEGISGDNFDYYPKYYSEIEIEAAYFFDDYVTLDATVDNDLAKYSDATEAVEKLYAFDSNIPIPVKIKMTDESNYSEYKKGENTLYISKHPNAEDYDDISVILHELGHFYIMNKLSLTYLPGGEHGWNSYLVGEDLAFSEAWATYFSCYLNETSIYTDYGTNDRPTIIIDVENTIPGPDQVSIPDGSRTEAFVCMALWDITDNASETHDHVNLNISNIISNITKMDKYDLTMDEFIKKWKNEGYNDIKSIIEHHKMNYDENPCSPLIIKKEKQINGTTQPKLEVTNKGVTNNEK